MTTFLVLAIDHDPSDDPQLWPWARLVDNPAAVGVAAAVTVDADGLDERAALCELAGRVVQLSPAASAVEGGVLA